MATQPSALVQPNLYQLSGDGRHVSFSPGGLDGKAHFSYQDAHQNSTFRGEDIRQHETDLGLVVSVTLLTSVEHGSTSFSLLLPRINLRTEQQTLMQTSAITTVHRSSIAPQFDTGQLDTYTVSSLYGMAAHVNFGR
jgi:hypothetical protein